MFALKRFLEKIDSAKAHRFDSGFDVALSSEENDREAGVLLLNSREQFQAVLPVEMDIEKDGFEFFLF